MEDGKHKNSGISGSIFGSFIGASIVFLVYILFEFFESFYLFPLYIILNSLGLLIFDFFIFSDYAFFFIPAISMIFPAILGWLIGSTEKQIRTMGIVFLVIYLCISIIIGIIYFFFASI